MLKEFREFAMKGNVIDLAVGIMLGTAFNAIVNSIVANVIMPPVGLLVGNVDFADLFFLLKKGEAPPPYATLADAQAAGAVTINYGLFVNALFSFLIIAFVLFLIIRSINRLKRKDEAPPAEPTTKACPYCKSEIPLAAIRCPQCTSQLESTST
jgi:large conductance mechanosensitive channel